MKLSTFSTFLAVVNGCASMPRYRQRMVCACQHLHCNHLNRVESQRRALAQQSDRASDKPTSGTSTKCRNTARDSHRLCTKPAFSATDDFPLYPLGTASVKNNRFPKIALTWIRSIKRSKSTVFCASLDKCKRSRTEKACLTSSRQGTPKSARHRIELSQDCVGDFQAPVKHGSHQRPAAKR